MLKKIKYKITFAGQYSCGHLHPVLIEVDAHDATDAIVKAALALEDERVKSKEHVLLSAVPVDISSWPLFGPEDCIKEDIA